MRVEVERTTEVEHTYRVARALGLFNVADDQAATFRLSADVPVEDRTWRIGAVYGPSGSGKSSIADALHAHGWTEWGNNPQSWPADKAVLDVVDASGSFENATAALASVGLGTVPTWLRPYRVLSNGERFRADLARLLTDPATDVYVDEFTSVVDRRVACIGAQAFAKAWRRLLDPRRVILLTPHEDVLGWLNPDWVIRTNLTGVTQTLDGETEVRPDVDRAAFGEPLFRVTS